MSFIEQSDAAVLTRNLSVLFVEDDDDVRENMARYLRRRIDNVHTAHNGTSGLQSFNDNHPDIVISDIRMGEMDGLTMCRKIREADPSLPVIIISAHNESDILLSSIDLGITKFIVKPVDTDELMMAISRIARAIAQNRDVENRLHLADVLRVETEYERESLETYVAHYLNANKAELNGNVRQLSIPKLGVSGDFVCVEQYRDNLYVLLGDGAGHGLSAAIPVVSVPGLFRGQVERGFSLQTISVELNRVLHDQNVTGYFLATTLLKFDFINHAVEVLNCGNPPAYLFDLQGGLIHQFHSRTPALGMLSDQEFYPEIEYMKVSEEVRVYAYTDGVSDTFAAATPDFSGDDLIKILQKSCRENRFDVVVRQIEAITQRNKIDDVTLLEIRFDGGSTVLPHDDAVFASASKIPEVENAEQPVLLNQITMLYVEDDEETRDFMTHYFNRRVGNVYVARDGQEGLDLFTRYRPQLILTDIKLPVLGGLAMVEKIRKMDRAVPIIAISGSDDAEDAEKMFDLGVSRFHVKPIDLAKLSRAMHDCIEQANLTSQLRFAFSAFQTSQFGVITTGADKRIVAVNPAFSRMTGYSAEEMIGHTPLILGAGTHGAAYFQKIWDALAAHGNWSGELICHGKDGGQIRLWMIVNAIIDENTKDSGFHFTFSDIPSHVNTQFDSLTNLPTRKMFERQLNEIIAGAQESQSCWAFAYVNIDRFREINNAMGVRAGDEALAQFSRRLLDSTGNRDLVCRLGGDEFALIIQNHCAREQLNDAVARLVNEVSRPIVVNGCEIQLRVSVGVSVYPDDGLVYDELIRAACSAMNQAQREGGGGYRFFDKSANLMEERRITLQQGIRRGLQRHEFFMLYQPKFSIGRNQVVGAEALIRWKHPVFGIISPAEFIPLAEESGDVIEMSDWIVDTVCRQLSEWKKAGIRQVPVSINISPVHFWRGSLVDTLRVGVQRWDVSPELLPIEVTEGVVMDSSEKTMGVLEELRSLGFHISIDDFGTGYSSLKYLSDLPISELKIDRSFVLQIPEDGVEANSASTAIPRAIIQLASEFGLTVVAEGVETQTQKQFLVEHGCDVIQGYLFSQPLLPEDFVSCVTKY